MKSKLVVDAKEFVRSKPFLYAPACLVLKTISKLKYPQHKLNTDIQRSILKQESIKQWWESCQEEGKNYWLTGSEPQHVWNSLNIMDRIVPGAVVLNIGIGRGYDTQELGERDCIVHALDISEAALERVRNVCEECWSADKIQDLPSNTFDLAVSYLVAQHMSNRDLLEQMTNVIRSLKTNGIFAIQFAFPLNNKIDENNESEGNIKSGGVVRTMDIFKQIVLEAKGDVIWSQEIARFSQYGSGSYGIHIKKLQDNFIK